MRRELLKQIENPTGWGGGIICTQNDVYEPISPSLEVKDNRYDRVNIKYPLSNRDAVSCAFARFPGYDMGSNVFGVRMPGINYTYFGYCSLMSDRLLYQLNWINTKEGLLHFDFDDIYRDTNIFVNCIDTGDSTNVDSIVVKTNSGIKVNTLWDSYLKDGYHQYDADSYLSLNIDCEYPMTYFRIRNYKTLPKKNVCQCYLKRLKATNQLGLYDTVNSVFFPYVNYFL